MGIMKVEKPIGSIIEAASEIDRDVAFEDYSEAMDILCSDDGIPVATAVRESGIADLANSSMPCLSIIGAMKNYIQKEYAIKTKKLLEQSKEVNDLYDKIKYLTDHDKWTRFKHGNDRVNATIKQTLLRSEIDGKLYNFAINDLVFNAEYYRNIITEKMNSTSNDAEILKWAKLVVDENESGFKSNYGWFTKYKIFIRTLEYKNQKVKDVLRVYEKYFEVNYRNIYYINNTVQIQMQYLQLVEKTYKDMMAAYGTSKARKAAIDMIFKEVLREFGLAIDFNNTATDIQLESLKHYASELQRVYDLIRS